MNKIKIQLIVTNSIDWYSYSFWIYNEKNILIHHCFVAKGEVSLFLEEGIYHIIILPELALSPRFYQKSIYLSSKRKNYPIYFLDTKKIRPITFILKDLDYSIPVERGKIELWPNHIQ